MRLLRNPIKVKELEVWLRGVDLNHRPLGYEFNTGFVVFRVPCILQQVRPSWFMVISAVSPVSLANC